MSKRFSIAKRISMEDIDHFEDIEVDDDFVDKDMVQIIADNEYDPMYDDCESIAVALQLAGYGKVADLEAKLAELNKEPLNCSQIENGMSLCVIQKSEIVELKQQLAEKEKTIRELVERSMENFKQMKEWKWQATIGNEQDKISFAVERLVNIQKYITDNAVFVEEECFGREINEFIDNQIEELKKEMK